MERNMIFRVQLFIGLYIDKSLKQTRETTVFVMQELIRFYLIKLLMQTR